MKMYVKLFKKEGIFLQKPEPWHSNYMAMYSSIWGGVVKDPTLMTVPVDDHMVHRGDGVFEVIKCEEGKVYQLNQHLKRLEKSAAAISLSLPQHWSNIRDIIVQTIRYGGERNCFIRLFVSRGPGGFTANPFECPQSQLYVVITKISSYNEKIKDGVSVIVSQVPIKPSYFANIKSCNYLPNVLMKREAIVSGVDYSISMDEKGFLAEGPTESLGVVTQDCLLKFPRFDRILKGITLSRAYELASEMITDGSLKEVSFCDITKEEAYKSREIVLFGTTFDVLAVVQFDGYKIGDGSPGPIFKSLRALFDQDLCCNDQLLTPVWD
jgi:branched-subunit amino acid aminotransferase/4-amino-4-deoxychorismate lyase